MSESTPSSSARQSRLPSVTSLRSVEESSPLLATLSNDGLKSYASVGAGTKTTESERVSTGKVLWIMSSFWMGTFMAGLGEQCWCNTFVALADSTRDES